MGGINELNDEIDNVLGPICEQSGTNPRRSVYIGIWVVTSSGVVLKSAASKDFGVIIRGGPILQPQAGSSVK